MIRHVTRFKYSPPDDTSVLLILPGSGTDLTAHAGMSEKNKSEEGIHFIGCHRQSYRAKWLTIDNVKTPVFQARRGDGTSSGHGNALSLML